MEGPFHSPALQGLEDSQRHAPGRPRGHGIRREPAHQVADRPGGQAVAGHGGGSGGKVRRVGRSFRIMFSFPIRRNA